MPCPAVPNRQNCACANDKSERIEWEVILPRQERPKGKECGNKEAGGDKDKTPARRHNARGCRGNDPARPENDERESDSKDNHPPCGMISDTWNNVVIENPIVELRPNAVECKRASDRSRNNQRADAERYQRAQNAPPTDTQSFAANENQSQQGPNQGRHEE